MDGVWLPTLKWFSSWIAIEQTIFQRFEQTRKSTVTLHGWQVAHCTWPCTCTRDRANFATFSGSRTILILNGVRRLCRWFTFDTCGYFAPFTELHACTRYNRRLKCDAIPKRYVEKQMIRIATCNYGDFLFRYFAADCSSSNILTIHYINYINYLR